MSDLLALQRALAAEQAAVYGYGVAGAFLRGSDRTAAQSMLTAHMNERDRLMSMVHARGARPVTPAAAYRLPFPVNDPASGRALAAELERGVAGAMWDLVAASEPGGATRAQAIGWLGATALRAAHWGATQALPGQPPPVPGPS
jgi:hypothetical protein